MKGKKDKALKSILSDYKKTIKELQNLQLKEIEFMEKNFGLEKAALYLQLKQNLSDEIRSALVHKEKQ